MELIKKYLTRENVIILACFGMIIGLFTSNFFRALPSAALITLLLFSVFRKDIFHELPNFFHYKNVFFILSLTFFLNIPSFFTTEIINIEDYWRGLERRTPFLGIGLALFFAPKLSPKIYLSFIYTFLVCTFLSALGSTIYYLLHFKEVSLLLENGKNLPVIVNHVRYSLFVCFGVFCGLYLYKENYSLFGKTWEKYTFIIMSLFLVIFAHISGVRSGLLSLYILISLSILYFIFKRKKYLLGGGILIISCLIPIITFLFVPSVKTKINITIEDLNSMNKEKDANRYSLHNRIISYKVGLKIWEEDVLFGVGSGNLHRKVLKTYIHHYDSIYPEKRILPHNQYIYIGASLGIVGLAIFLFSFYYPLLMNENYKNTLLMIHYIIISISFLAESTIETQLGTAYTLTFIFLPLFFMEKNVTIPPTEKSVLIKL